MNERKKFSEAESKFYFAESIIALQELHSMNIIYRDLKPENILLDIDGHIKLADFGLSNITDPNELRFTYGGSPSYMAPEMIEKRGHTITLDYYTLGALLYELVSGCPPFYSN